MTCIIIPKPLYHMIIVIQAGRWGGLHIRRIRWIIISIVTVIQFSGKRLVEFGLFFSLYLSALQGKSSPKIPANTQTDKLTTSNIFIYISTSVHPLPTSQIRWRFILEIIELTARVASIHAIFQLAVRRIRMFFSLKPSPSQGESSLKISGRWGSPFRRS